MSRGKGCSTIAIVLMLCLYLSTAVSAEPIIADHTSVAEFDLIPQSYIDNMQSAYHIYYGHTSHGSQIVTGIDMILSEDATCIPPAIHEVADDLGSAGDTTWVPDIRSYIASHPECNMVMMSWCGGAAASTEAQMDIYLNKMASLEIEYPSIVFIYMTGHLDKYAPITLKARNEQIRQYCIDNEKVLFDFADIESFDPDGTYYPNENDECDWCTDWCLTHTCPTCTECAHSHCFNCYQKGKAWWVMMANISGWSLVADVESLDNPSLPSGFALSQNYPNPFNPETSIEFSTPKRGRYSLVVYNVLGTAVRTLADKDFGAGTYRVSWDGRDNSGEEVSSGVYIYRLQSESNSLSRKMLLLR